MARELPSASLLENLQFNQAVILPNAVQGLFRRRPTAVALATRVNVDGEAVGLVSRLRRNYEPGPVWVQVMNTKALLVLEVDDIRRVLEGAPHPFAADPEAKRKGMSAFQPYALTLSRGELWRDRRAFTEAVLDSAEAKHRELGDRIAAVATEETAVLLDDVDRSDGQRLDYDAFHHAFQRIVRRVVFGDAARDDEELSEELAALMSEANGLPGKRSDRLDPFMERLRTYVERAEPGSLVALFGNAPSSPDTRVEGQIPHWLFAMQDTLSLNALRALALLASHPEQRAKAAGDEAYLHACLQEAMRLWPTTPLLSRETLVELNWNGAVVPAGTQILIFNTYFHRDGERLEYANRFAPEEWTEGHAAGDWRFNHFSHGPQGCPGANLSLLIGSAVLATLLTQREVRQTRPKATA
jgi:cytochrome P450